MTWNADLNVMFVKLGDIGVGPRRLQLHVGSGLYCLPMYDPGTMRETYFEMVFSSRPVSWS